ncbi:MAG: Uma2 family endonuclease [Chloroflexota bacterium]
MAQQTQTRITTTEYYDLPAYKENDFIQLIAGEVIIPMPPIVKHQIIVSTILVLLSKIAETIGGLAIVAPTEVKLDDENVFEPDVFYIVPENMSIAEQDEKRIVGAPDLIVEVLSPSTARYDRQQKYLAYQEHGVREYWIVDPVHETIEVWTLSDEARFELQGAFSAGDTFTSTCLQADISADNIFATK